MTRCIYPPVDSQVHVDRARSDIEVSWYRSKEDEPACMVKLSRDQAMELAMSIIAMAEIFREPQVEEMA